MATASYVSRVCHDRELVRYYQANLAGLLWQHQGRLPLQDLLLLSLEPRVVRLLEDYYGLETTGSPQSLLEGFLASEEGQSLLSTLPADTIEMTLQHGSWPEIQRLVTQYGQRYPQRFLEASVRLGLGELTDDFWEGHAPQANSVVAQYLFYQALENDNTHALAKLTPLLDLEALSPARLERALLRSDHPAWFELYGVRLEALHPSMLTEARPALFGAYLEARAAYVDLPQYRRDLAVLVQAALQTGRGYQVELLLKYQPDLDLGAVMEQPHSRVELAAVLAFGDRQTIELVMANLEAHLE